LVAHPVSTLVNSVSNDAPELIEPVNPEPEPQLELFDAKTPRR
jgi:hypothetical protein